MLSRLLLITLFPIIRLSGLPIPVYLPFGVMRLIHRRVQLRTEYVFLGLIATIYFLGHLLTSLLLGIPLQAKDFSYFIFPLLYAILISVFFAEPHTDRLIKVYFYANVIVNIVVVCIPPALGLLKYYYMYASGHIVTSTNLIAMAVTRPGGLIANPTWYGFLVYLLGKYLSIREKNDRYLILAFVGIVLSTARAAMLVFLCIEGYRFVKAGKSAPGKLLRVLLVLAFCVGIFLFVYHTNALFHHWLELTIADLRSGGQFRDYSMSYRTEMYSWVASSITPLSLLFGGTISTALLPSLGIRYIDSELVMRLLQFGLFGYLALLGPMLLFYHRARRMGHDGARHMAKFLLLFAVTGALANTVTTNMLFIIYITSIIGRFEQEFAAQEAPAAVTAPALAAPPLPT